MKKKWIFRRLTVGGGMWIVVAVLLVAAFLMVGNPANAADKKPCYETADYALKACKNAADEVYNLALGRCENIPEGKQSACEKLAQQDKAASNDECTDQLKARNSVCKELGGGPYALDYRKVTFTTPDQSPIDSYFPLTPKKYTYYSYNEAYIAIERDEVTVTDQTRDIERVTCRVILDIVTDLTINFPKGQKAEDTTDWYALDEVGNVWYFGEIAQQFDKDGILVGIDGSWTTGKDGARPGYNMLVNPKKGDVYRQEFALGEAEDMARVMGKESINDIRINKLPLDEFFKIKLSKFVPDRGAPVLLHTQDFSALDPLSVLEDQYEDKYYAPGFGAVLIIGPLGKPIEVLESVEEYNAK